MKKKLNWGHGIAITLGAFLLLNLIVIVFVFRQDVQLVTDNYYEKELKYEDDIVMMRNALNLPDSLKINLNNVTLEIFYPASLRNNDVKGNIHLYRPDQKKFDYNIAVKYDSTGFQTINMAGKAPGKWKISILVNDGSIDYLFKEDVFLR